MMKAILKSIFNKLGYSLISKESLIPKDLRDQVHNPLLAKYFARKSNFLINADFKKCITINHFSCEKTGNNPLVNTVRDYLKNGSISYSGSELENFYNNYTPKNVAEMFNLKGKLHDNLVRLSAVLWVLPWENADMESKKKFRERFIKFENERRGKVLSLEHGWGAFGPVSREFGKLEIKTLVRLTNSISNKGYFRGDDLEQDIKATILVKDRDYKYSIYDGNHRAAVLSALGYKLAPVRVQPRSIPAFIYRNEVDYWPKVKDGLYSRDQALKIFDTMFSGS